MERAKPQRPRTDRELHRARDGIVIGECERSVTELEPGHDKLIR
jgi:hypothetical protein